MRRARRPIGRSPSPLTLGAFRAPAAAVSLLALLFCAVSARAQDAPDWIAEEAASLLSRAIRVRTVNPPGNEAPLVDLLVAELREQKIEARRIDTPDVAAPGPALDRRGPGRDNGRGDDSRAGSEPASSGRRAALWARLPGAPGGARPLILLSHLDVVGANAPEWQHDPFAGLIEDGYIYGRGALDAKGVTVVQTLALIALARRPEPLDRDIILLATPDEESGGHTGAGFITRSHGELLRDAEFLLTEGGGIRPAKGPERPSIWGVTVTEKSPCWLELSARGSPGHGAAPRRDAAVPRLIAALDRIRRMRSPLHVLSEVERMFRALARSAAPADRAEFASLASALEEDSNFRRRFLADPSHNSLVRDTVSITVLEGSPRVNVVPARASARLDARLLPGERCEDFVAMLRELIADPNVEIEPLLSFPSRSSPSDTDLFHAIERVAKRVEPDAIVVPRMIAGFTDAHWFRERGIVAYGFVPRWLTRVEARGIHGVSERISIENLRNGVETLVAILEELAAPEPERADDEPLARDHVLAGRHAM